MAPCILRDLAPKRRGCPTAARQLSAAQARKIRQQILDKMPDQLKLGCYLWTRSAVVALIARENHVVVSLTTVGRYLEAWGFSVQQPVRSTYERNDVAIARWLRADYPAFERDAKREEATTFGAMRRGLRSDHISGTSYAPVGQTQVVVVGATG